MALVHAADFAPSAPSQPLDAVIASLATCALLMRLRRPVIERLLDEGARLQILHDLSLDAPDFVDVQRQRLAALAPVFEAALAFASAYQASVDRLRLAFPADAARAS